MVGIAYGFFTEWLGLGPQIHKAGSLMGLAAHGVAFEHVEKDIEHYVDRCFHTEEGAYHQWMADLWSDLARGAKHFEPDQKDSDRAKDIAATIQLIFERAVLRAVQMYVLSPNVCLGGGSFLNCNVNTAIHNLGKNVHLFPACGDDGLAVGTALYIAHHVFGEPRASYDDQEICYLGRDHPVKEMDYDFLAKELEHGKSIAWCNGRSEYGPRALGNRSILMEPTCAANLEHVNQRIKNREWFRPLAPSVLADHAPEWFEGGPAKSPFMLHTAQSKTRLVPAVTHVDGSSRIQTVTQQSNPHFYKLIDTYRQRTGIPMLLNTSLNVNGEPIVETEEDARRFFAQGNVDYLVLNGEVISK
jgi:carbamoyltransferase